MRQTAANAGLRVEQDHVSDASYKSVSWSTSVYE